MRVNTPIYSYDKGCSFPMRTLTVTIGLIITITAIRAGYSLFIQLPLLKPVLSNRAFKSTIVVDGDKTLRSKSESVFATMTSTNTIANDSSILTRCRLTYFGITGRGEAIRLTLAISGVQFEDNRVPFSAWDKIKPTTPWGTLPILELSDGTQLSQTHSILRFVGKHTGLYPIDDELVAQRIDELMDKLEEVCDIITNTGKDLPKDEMEDARLIAVSNGGTVYNLLNKIDTFIATNSKGSGYAVGNEMNIASILTFTLIGRLVGGVYNGVPSTAFDPFPNIQKVRKTTGCYPSVQHLLSPAERVMIDCKSI